jgi:hypothetical protein
VTGGCQRSLCCRKCQHIESLELAPRVAQAAGVMVVVPVASQRRQVPRAADIWARAGGRIPSCGIHASMRYAWAFKKNHHK